MNIEKYYTVVESVLKNYPKEYMSNYIKNKKTVKINYEESIVKTVTGSYDNELNEIFYSQEASLPHELFHMSFRDEEKVEKKIFEDSCKFYSNGVSFYEYIDGNKITYAEGVTEGFAEWLSKKCISGKGRILEAFFIDLLISIYGEEIIKYPLNNDPIGFIEDERFFDILNFIAVLDILCDAKDSISLMVSFKDIFEKPPESKEEAKEIFFHIKRIRNRYKKSIIKLFQSIINEFINCKIPNINKQDFINKLLVFLNDSTYLIAFVFDDLECSVKNEVKSIIDNFSQNKIKDLKQLKR